MYTYKQTQKQSATNYHSEKINLKALYINS